MEFIAWGHNTVLWTCIYILVGLRRIKLQKHLHSMYPQPIYLNLSSFFLLFCSYGRKKAFIFVFKTLYFLYSLNYNNIIYSNLNSLIHYIEHTCTCCCCFCFFALSRMVLVDNSLILFVILFKSCKCLQLDYIFSSQLLLLLLLANTDEYIQSMLYLHFD